MKRAILNCLISSICCSVYAQHASPIINRYVISEIQAENIPGLSLGVYSNGRAICEQGFGLSNIESRKPVSPATLFNSGSLAKQFVAVAIMMLAEKGKLSIEENITKYFADAPDSWNGIKIKNLLSHTSGLGDYSTTELTLPGAVFDFNKDMTESDLLKNLYQLPLLFKPGSDWSYCNTNYVLLGMLIKKVTGQAWDYFLQQQLFDPLGMTATHSVRMSSDSEDVSVGYNSKKGKLMKADRTAPIWNSTADGDLYLNVADLAKWYYDLSLAKILKKATLKLMWTVFRLNNNKPNAGGYGFGFFIKHVNGHKLIDHEGNWAGYSDYFGFYPDQNIAVAVLTNLGYPLARPKDIAAVVVGLYHKSLMPTGILPIHDQQPQLTKHLFTALTELINGKPQFIDYATVMQRKLKDLGPVQAFLQAQGSVNSFELVEKQVRNKRSTFIYRVRMKERIFTVRFDLNKSHKIMAMNLAA